MEPTPNVLMGAACTQQRALFIRDPASLKILDALQCAHGSRVHPTASPVYSGPGVPDNPRGTTTPQQHAHPRAPRSPFTRLLSLLGLRGAQLAFADFAREISKQLEARIWLQGERL
ncbi:hypothetical protein NDU88_004273 [Pleurodeles waltl]|uniref:Uncharacterized protein n=1 Tax=Pleurodeles waltl TaxID=8319 RepID=A0AAV7UF65_PLEWA|nr:hypothetical protein NDU88_004273 [Pleurodeles waltl]